MTQEQYVIRGNDALVKCDIPSFVADLVTVVSWHDNNGQVYHSDNESYGNCAGFFYLKIKDLFGFHVYFKFMEYLS